MALKICKECGAEVSSKGICPKCGKDQRNFFIKHKVVTFILILAVLGAIVGASGSENKSNSTASSTTTSSTASSTTTSSTTSGVTTEQKQDRLNLEKFNKIETGMSYQEVVNIIGEEGTVLSESEIGNIKSTIYSWYGEGSIGANANVTFQNGKVVSKAQVGLK